MFDVLDIEAELINAKIDLVNAVYDKIYAQYRILSGMGQLVHTLGLRWPVEGQVENDRQIQTREEDKSASKDVHIPNEQLLSLDGKDSYDS